VANDLTLYTNPMSCGRIDRWMLAEPPALTRANQLDNALAATLG